MADCDEPVAREVDEVFGLANRVIAVLDRCESPLRIVRALEIVLATFCRNAPSRADALLLSRGMAKHVAQMIKQDRREVRPMSRQCNDHPSRFALCHVDSFPRTDRVEDQPPQAA